MQRPENDANLSCLQVVSRRSLLALTLLLLTRTSDAQPKAVVVERSTVLTGKEGDKLFKQCSRRSPEGITGYWNPTAADLHELNKALTAFLKTDKTHHRRKLSDYYRQCAGFLRRDKQYIYVNAFAPQVKRTLEETTPKGKSKFDWRRDAMVACDGGSNFFGVEYDVEKGQFSQLSFNGMA